MGRELHIIHAANHQDGGDDRSQEATVLVQVGQFGLSRGDSKAPRSEPTSLNRRRLPWTKLAIEAGQSDVPSRMLNSDQPPQSITVGSGSTSMWQVQAAGVAALHLALHWDGQRLWVAAPKGLDHGVEVNDAPLVGEAWTIVPDHSRVVFGQAAIRVTTLYNEPVADSSGLAAIASAPSLSQGSSRASSPVPSPQSSESAVPPITSSSISSSDPASFPTPPAVQDLSESVWRRLRRFFRDRQGGPQNQRRRLLVLVAAVLLVGAATSLLVARRNSSAQLEELARLANTTEESEAATPTNEASQAAATAPTGSPVVGPPGIDVPQRAAELLAHGRDAHALRYYRWLATSDPNTPAYATIVRVLQRRLRDRCADNATPGSGPCPADEAAEELGSLSPSQAQPSSWTVE
jgi:HAMP domain-containing protein